MIRNIIIFDIVLAVIMYSYGYYRGYDAVQQKYVAERLRSSEMIRQLERQSEERQNGLIQNYLAQIDLYKKTIDAYTDADNIRLDSLRDSRKCPAVPAKAKAESGLVCYTPADIRKKIAESVAVGAECDQLAIRYKTLVEVCDVKGNDTKPGD